MFRPSNFEPLEFIPPIRGMRRNVSEEIYDPQYCSWLENIIPSPLGESSVRYGTRVLNGFPLNLDKINILGMFPFPNGFDESKMLVIVEHYQRDEGAQVIAQTLAHDAKIRLRVNNKGSYVSSSLIKIEARLGPVDQMIRDEIISVTPEDDDIIVELSQNIPLASENIDLIKKVFHTTATIYVFDTKTNTLNVVLEGYNPNTKPRAVFFQGHVIICNGVDPILSWNGGNAEESLSWVRDVVRDRVTGLAREKVDEHAPTYKNLTFTKGAVFNPDHYRISDVAGQTPQVTLRTQGVETMLTITNYAEDGNQVTLTCQEDVPEVIEGTEIFFQIYPPRFNFLYVGNDRLWGLGPGAVSIQGRSAYESMRVYYADKTNSITGWYKENTQTVASINIADKHGIQDNLEGIYPMGSYSVLVGRSRTQLWKFETHVDQSSWVSTVPIGAIHGDLVIELPNDLLIVSPQGCQTFSTLNVAKQFAATSNSHMDFLVKDYIKNILVNEREYRFCSSFVYKKGGFFGLKIGLRNTLCASYSTLPEAWFIFSGDFSSCSTFGKSEQNLFLARDRYIMAYADGTETQYPVYGDGGGVIPIRFVWGTNVIQNKGRGFACKRARVIMKCPSEFSKDGAQELRVLVLRDDPDKKYLSFGIKKPVQGDIIGSVPFSDLLEPQVQDPGFMAESSVQTIYSRMKFMAHRFFVDVTGYVKSGPLSFKNVTLYGVHER